MKSKNISFADVLKKNTKSPRMDFMATNSSLLSMFEEFQSNPDQDYTLYLAQTNQSHRGKLKSFQMQHSKYTNEHQQELFDSWIQKQSFMTSNKENIRTQSKKSPINDQIKKSEGFKRIQPNSRSKGDSYLSNQANSKERSSRALENYQENFIPLQIEMIKSKGYEPTPSLQRATSPKSKFNTQNNPINVMQPSTSRGAKKIADQKPIPENNKKLAKQIEKQPEQVLQKPKMEAQSFKSFTKINESVQSLKIQEDISNITKKYMDQKYLDQDQDDLEDEQLLLQNSSFPFSRNQSEKTHNQTQKKQSNFDKSEEINKKRMEQAKNVIGDYFKNIKKAKKPEQQNYCNDFQSNKCEYRNSSSNAHEVGYSFSTAFQQNEKNEDKVQAIKPITQLQSQNPNESLNDSDFRLKYLNLRSSEAVEQNQYIQNIQSVRYDDFSHRNIQINAPYDSFKVKLILSNDKQKKQQNTNYEQNISNPKEQKIEYELKQRDPQLKKSLELVTSKPLGKSKQKISLISSNKSKTSSNKASPQMPVNSQRQPQIITTDFNMQSNIQQKKSIQNKPYSNQFLDKKQEEKKFIEKPFYHAKKEDFIQLTTPKESLQKQQKPVSSKQAVNSTDHQLSSPPSLSTNYVNQKPILSNYSTYVTSPYVPVANTPSYPSPTVTAPTYATSTPSVSIPTIMKTSNFNSSIERTYYATTSNEPTYSNTTKNQYLGAKVYAYSPMKTQNSYIQEYVKEQIKKQNYPHVIKPIVPQSSNSYEQKYALPQHYSDKEKSIGKNYLSKLEIKESINLVQSNTEKQVDYKQNIQFGSNKCGYMNTFGKDQKNSNPIFSNSGLGSLKQSINVSEGDQFTFDL